MKEIKLSDVLEINPYWLIYRNENREKAYLDLSASANSFSRAMQLPEEDGLRCVGLRYEENGTGCYELFNIGHTKVVCPLKPGFFAALAGKLGGKDPEKLLREAFEAFEQRLNAAGWKTVAR